MKTSAAIGLIVVAVTGLGLVGLSIPLLMGKCAGLIAGYNTMSPEEKASWDAPALARFTGKIVLTVGLLTLVMAPVFCFFEIAWLTAVYTVAVVGLGVFAAVWCNTGNRFRK